MNKNWILLHIGRHTFLGKVNSHVNRLAEIHFILPFLSSFLALSGKINDIQANVGHNNTEHAWTPNLACTFL